MMYKITNSQTCWWDRCISSWKIRCVFVFCVGNYAILLVLSCLFISRVLISTYTEQFHTLADPICVSFNCFLRHQHVLNDYYVWICLVLAIRNCLHWILWIAYKTMTFIFIFAKNVCLIQHQHQLWPQCLFLYSI